jgi:Surp module
VTLPPAAAAPTDPEMKKVIDNMAEFVSKNGVEFEKMVRARQKDNPKLSFLHGGPFAAYYDYIVACRRAGVPPKEPSASAPPPPPPSGGTQSDATPPPWASSGGPPPPPSSTQQSSAPPPPWQQTAPPVPTAAPVPAAPSAQGSRLSPSDEQELRTLLASIEGTKDSIKVGVWLSLCGSLLFSSSCVLSLFSFFFFSSSSGCHTHTHSLSLSFQH